MTIQDRILEAERKFNEHQASREAHLRGAEDDQTEMTKLQGEYRVLQDLLQDQNTNKRVNKKATTIEAVPEGEVK